MDIKDGSKVYYLSPKYKAWRLGTLVGTDPIRKDKVKIADEVAGEGSCTVDRTEIHRYFQHGYDPSQDDLFNMGDLHPATLLYCVVDRFQKLNQQYTRMGEIILSVNPFTPMPYNQSQNMIGYVRETNEAPHCWQIAHKAFRNLVIRDRGNQSVLISGESGAGKTETTKLLLEYLGRLSQENSAHAIQQQTCARVNQQLRDSNPILESFGNAKTVRNDNSSRFGKYIKLQLDAKSGVIIGAEMVTYLLEKSRIVQQGEGERGYHVFYEFLAGASPQEKARYGNLKTAKDYRCLNRGNCYQRRSTDGSRIVDDAVAYKELVQAMERLGIDASTRDQLFAVLAAILHLQNVEFGVDANTGKATLVGKEAMATAANLLGVDPEKLASTFTIKSSTNIMTTLSTKNEAEDMRDAVSKALYQAVFDWIVDKLNDVIKGQQVPTDVKYIGLLDIFGFENFTNNSFEQLCINYTNEALQNHYNKYIFVEDAKECEQEGIKCPIVDYPDNQPCVDLIEKTGGIFTVLDQETHFKLGTDKGFTEKLWTAWDSKNQFFIKPKSTVPNAFGVHHYAGDVSYNTEGWLEKNADTLKDEVREIISASRAGPFISALLPPVSEDVKSGRVKKSTVGGKFRNQLLMLREELSRTESHFIRCVKPNPECEKGRADPSYVLIQLNSAGVVHTIAMKRDGYPVRMTHNDFWQRFRCIAHKPDRLVYDKCKKANARMPPPQELCNKVLLLYQRVYGYQPENYAIGKTKVFMKPFVIDALENTRSRKLRRYHRKLNEVLIKYIHWRRAEKERLKALQPPKEEIQFANNTAADVQDFARGQGGVSPQCVKLFEELATIFPHFDLPVILGVAENVQNRDQAINYLMDMQRQRIDQHLPRSMKLVLDLADIRTEMQEKMAAKGFSTKEQVFKMTEEDMNELGFSAKEMIGLKKIILSQQSNWIAQERLNEIYPIRPLVRPGSATAATTTRPAAGGHSTRPSAPPQQPPKPSAPSGGGIPNLSRCPECNKYLQPGEIASHQEEHKRRKDQFEADEAMARRLQAQPTTPHQQQRPQVPAAKPSGPYGAQLIKLREMGCTDDRKNLELLQRFNGDLNQVVNALMS